MSQARPYVMRLLGVQRNPLPAHLKAVVEVPHTGLTKTIGIRQMIWDHTWVQPIN